MESILKTIRKLIGPEEDYTYFDPQLIIHINSAFSRLCQLNVGPTIPFRITSADETWSDFMPNEMMPDNVKDFIYLYVKKIFDPPQNSFLMTAINEEIEKLEWLLNSEAEVGYARGGSQS